MNTMDTIESWIRANSLIDAGQTVLAAVSGGADSMVHPMGIGGFAQMLVPMYENTWLPALLLAAYGYGLPLAETVLGGLLVGMAWFWLGPGHLPEWVGEIPKAMRASDMR